ncbi:NADH-ubiquinone oxidoreductase subunit E family protein [Helicobacter sp. MIT 14-3879]|uniref:NADH-ubiquinone oxidoreductase subunit E family protein n=1 Tax=Helicobacter sp. MIT 14-3879 TaxID=2040649 RepID=UPI000E1EDD41|nr:NADH-ubiquinone oxidoreductase subunit E family protein [Helicobacter sp. MIT 14-3879]RDU63939.1 hypothetical protein CQA44_04685 [Helicobacter sp. MIT 14-3879]
MKRFDLRHLKGNFLDKLIEIINNNLSQDEVAIFIFEINDFDDIQKSADLIKENNFTLMNSLRFNEVDWTLVVKKSSNSEILETKDNKIGS